MTLDEFREAVVVTLATAKNREMDAVDLLEAVLPPSPQVPSLAAHASVLGRLGKFGAYMTKLEGEGIVKASLPGDVGRAIQEVIGREGVMRYALTDRVRVFELRPIIPANDD